MEGSQAPSSSLPNNLLCPEDKSCLNEDTGQMENKSLTPQQIPCFNPDYHDDDDDYDDDYIKSLVQKEMLLGSNFGSAGCFAAWLRVARSDAINWILTTQTQLGLRNQTAHLSLTYFDRFLSMRRIDEDKLWAIRLLSIACLSIAAKMEESRVPTLSEYPMDDDFKFDWQVFQKMELLVLGTMGWKINLITPFPFINYFVRKFADVGIKQPDGLASTATELVMSMTKEVNLMEYRPSVIAAAAVLAAVDWQLTQEALKLKISTVSLWETSENQQEKLISCYSIMQRLIAVNNPSTPNLTQDDEQIVCATTSNVGAKRKLSFSDGGQKPDSPRED